MADGADDKRRAELDQQLTGPLSTTTQTVDAESGLVPPPWWDGDEEAARTSMAALIGQ